MEGGRVAELEGYGKAIILKNMSR